MPRSSLRVIVVVLLLQPAALGSAYSQTSVGPAQAGSGEGFGWVDELNFFSMNALLGGIAAGVLRSLNGGSFRQAFSEGMIGGGLGFLGKRLSGARFAGAGCLGRQVAAVGGSIVRNSGRGIGVLDTLYLPVGPFLGVIPSDNIRTSRASVDLFQAARVLSGVLDDRFEVDWRRSASAGTFVFLADGELEGRHGGVDGIMGGGTIFLNRHASGELAGTFSHERVHLAQWEILQTGLGAGLEDWMLGKINVFPRRLLPHTRMGVGALVAWYPLRRSWGDGKGLLEIEAAFMEVR